ncbi:hypothetical protein JCM10207_008094 [Rhodosporidiobolus poonsookiae]
MSDSAPRGRGRGRGRRTAATTLSGQQVVATPSPAPESTAASRASTSDGTPTPAPQEHGQVDDAPSGDERAADSRAGSAAPASAAKPSIKRVASVGRASSRAPSVGLSRTPSVGAGASGGAARDRPVGGLLGSTSEFRAGGAAASAGAAGKPRFKPNMRRTQRVVESDDDEDVKMEDADDYRKKRGPRPARAPRQELEMTASGPMAQGPGGPPRAWGARPAGASGAAVMAASRAGTLNRMLDDDSDASDLEVDGDGATEEGGVRFKAVDLNDIGLEGGEEGLPPMVLPRDPKVLRTKIKRLQERKQERLKKEAREKAKSEGIVKTEPLDTTPGGTPGPSSTVASGSGSGSATPAPPNPFDSKEGSLALVDEDKEAKDLKDLEEEEKKEIILSEAFEVAPDARGELYMFQFPRKFPTFVPSSSLKNSSATKPDPDDLPSSVSNGIKPDPDAPSSGVGQSRRKPAPPEWGRFGSRDEKAARWSDEAGRIGELCVHKSGKVTLRLNGDLRYEVLPAAQPSFLQEVAIIDHPAPKAGSSSTRRSKPSSSKKKKRRSSSSSSSGSSSSSDSDTAPAPSDALVIVGQTRKKFLVVPDVADLLDKVGLQEKEERDEERRVKLAKAGVSLGGFGAPGAVKKEGRR